MKPSAPELGSLDRRVPSDKPVRLAWFDERGQIRCVTGRCIDVSSRCGFELILLIKTGHAILLAVVLEAQVALASSFLYHIDGFVGSDCDICTE